MTRISDYCLVRTRTEAVEEVADVLSRAFVPLRLEPTDPDAFAPDMELRRVGRVTLARLSFGSEVRIRTAELQGYHLDISLAGTAHTRLGRGPEIETPAGTAGVFSPGETSELRWAAGTVEWCAMFGPELVREELTNLLGRDPNRPLEFVPTFSVENVGKALLDAIRLLETVADDEVLSANPLLARRLEQTAVTTLLLAHQHNFSDELRRETSRMSERLARRAVELLHGSPERAWSVGELATACGVSARTLYDGFRAVTGTSPMNYLQQIRLDSVHDNLLSADEDASVSSIAYRWGFTHLGRFAAAYRRRFGEPPSATMRRRE